MTPEQKRQRIDQYNIFELLGIGKTPPPEKRKLLEEMNLQIWNEFLFARIDKILTREQLDEVEVQLNQGKTFEEILEFISSLVPNFYELYAEFVREAKTELIKEQFESSKSDIQNALENALENKEKIDLAQKLEKYQKAEKLLENYSWEALKLLMSSMYQN